MSATGYELPALVLPGGIGELLAVDEPSLAATLLGAAVDAAAAVLVETVGATAAAGFGLAAAGGPLEVAPC